MAAQHACNAAQLVPVAVEVDVFVAVVVQTGCVQAPTGAVAAFTQA
jgi:hypothetical protein